MTATGAAIALGCVALASPFFISRAVLPWGFNVFFFWSALCVAAVFAGKMFVWGILSCGALLMVSVDWWMNGPPPVNEYGFGAIDAIALFSATALVVAATGALSVILTAVRYGRRSS
jgi:hypothetical protein